jgi:hypothetical protein
MKTVIQIIIEQRNKLSQNDFDTWILSNKKELLVKEKEQIIEARLDGFKISGEGWNGEYPFEGKSDKEINTRIDNEGYYNQTYNQ